MTNKMVRINCKGGVHDMAKLNNKTVKEVLNTKGETEHLQELTEVMVCSYCGYVLRPFEQVLSQEDQPIKIVGFEER